MAVTCLTLDDLIALNRQIAALARAGAPLERGLQSFAHETPGRLGQVAEQISERMAQGSSLPEATAQLPGVPPVYVAVVEAGLRAGRLPAALEGLAEVARRMSQLRCAAALAMAYPLAVLHTAYFLLLFFVTKIATALATSLEDGSSSVTPFFRWLSRLGQWLAPWWFVPPLAITALVIFWWWQTSRSLVLEPRMGSRWMGWMPLFGRLQHDSQRAVFTQTLGLLLENGQPLAESLVLAAQTAGGRRLGLAADQARRALQQGAPAAESLRRCGLPPLVCCALVASAAQQELADTLRRLSDDYHRRAAYQAERIRLILPLLLTFGLAGTAVALYALILFLPWTTLLRELAQPNGG